MQVPQDDQRVIVIGSGPSGAMAALTLLQRGIPVTMLESGLHMPRGLLLRARGHTLYRTWPTLPNHGSYVASENRQTMWFHDFVPGGLSNYWTGAVPRFAPEDFTEGERLHERYRWPIEYEDLRPYYERVERLLLVSGGTEDVPNLPAGWVAYPRALPRDWHSIAARAQNFGQGLVPMPLATGTPWMLSRSAAPFNSYTVIVQKLKRFPYFQLLLGAHALRLEWSGEWRKVRSVVYFDHAAGCERKIDGAAVVVAGGPLSSTKLLLNSACADFPGGLGDTEGILGRYLHDHAHDWYQIELDRPLSRLNHTHYLTRAPYQDSEPLRAASCTFGGGVTKLQKVLALMPTKTTRFGITVFGSIVPLERNSVSAHPTAKDEFGLPQLDLHIQFDDSVRPTIAAARERLLAILDAAGFQPKLLGEPPNPIPGGSVHYGGTVRMHTSPKYGMLNAWNRLHAVENVIVADASSFTTGVEKNPTLTAMALAARAADRLAMDLKALQVSQKAASGATIPIRDSRVRR